MQALPGGWGSGSESQGLGAPGCSVWSEEVSFLKCHGPRNWFNIAQLTEAVAVV